jgi:hypothetical protein
MSQPFLLLQKPPKPPPSITSYELQTSIEKLQPWSVVPVAGLVFASCGRELCAHY